MPAGRARPRGAGAARPAGRAPPRGSQRPGAAGGPLLGPVPAAGGTQRRAQVAAGRFEAGTARRGAAGRRGGMRELAAGLRMEGDILDALEALG